MGHFTIHLKKGDDPTIFIERAVEVMKEGGIIAFPTDTVYGLGVDPSYKMVREQLAELKGCEDSSKFPLLMSDIEQAKKIGSFSKYELALATKFWPGPLTLIVPRSPLSKSKTKKSQESPIDDIFGQKSGFIAIRVSNHPIVVGLCEKIKEVNLIAGILSTSATNQEGGPLADGKQVVQEYSNIINFILDTGKCELGIPSTVVKINQEVINTGGSVKDAVEIIREGPISAEDISKVISKV